MSEYLHLVFSAYVVFLIIDVTRAYYKCRQQEVFLDLPRRRWIELFFEEHKWSVGTVLVFGLLGWFFV